MQTAMVAGLALVTLAPGLLAAEFKPEVACQFMDSEGLKTKGGYSDQGGGSFRCGSFRKTLPAGGSKTNEIEYYAQGSASAVKTLTLKLTMNTLQDVQRSHRYLLDYTRELAQRALGVEVPPAMADAILAGVAGEFQVGTAQASVSKAHVYASSYELLVQIR